MRWLGALALAAVASGCQLIGGIGDRRAASGDGEDASTDSATSAGGSSADGATGSGGAASSGGDSGSGGAGGATAEAEPCVLNSDCSGGLVCIFATCSIACRLDADCDPGFRCLDTAQGAACVDIGTSTCDRTCPSGTTCVSGVCRTPCVQAPDAGAEAGVDSGADGSADAAADAHDAAGSDGATGGGLDASGEAGDAGDGGGCRADQTCVNGGCVGKGETSADSGTPLEGGSPEGGAACRAGDHQCSGKIPQTCSSGQWVDGVACTYLCDVGACTGVCTPNSLSCSGKTPRTCGSDGQWQDSAPCTYSCSAGACVGECNAGDKQCSGTTARTCDSTYHWVDTVCPSLCVSGDCATSCTPNTKQCSGTTPQTCNSSGNWVDGSPCPYACSGGNCTGVCVPNTKQCVNGVPQACDSTGQWVSGSACPYLCTNGNCTGVCTPGNQRCNGYTPQTCDSTGQWVNGTTCDSTTSVCDPVTYTCKKFDGQTCAAKTDCQSNVCKDGFCCDSVCTGSCQSCAVPGKEGSCSSVTGQTDPDTCTGIKTCNGTGQCALVDGQSCSIASDCVNNNCNTYYPDADGDGWGTTNGVKFCGPKPAGYAFQPGDCCDQDARAYPGESQGGDCPYGCGWYPFPNFCGTNDYDCNGVTDKASYDYPICNAACSNSGTSYCVDGNAGCGNTAVIHQTSCFGDCCQSNFGNSSILCR